MLKKKREKCFSLGQSVYGIINHTYRSSRNKRYEYNSEVFTVPSMVY
jgi:hypothetical protein